MLPLPFGLRRDGATCREGRGREGRGRGGGGVIRVHTCSVSLSALTQSGEGLTHELSTLRAQSGSCHGDLTWALTF